MYSMGHPVFGDLDYDGTRAQSVQMTGKLQQRINNMLEIMPRQALHAKVLGFHHPITGKFVRFESDLPEDMKELIKKL
jgi:23S rRNA pseudouridine1911/1915/1917 synthase